MSAADKIDYIIRTKQAGFFIRLFFVSTESPTINAKHVTQRVLDGGHDVPIPKIISRYDKVPDDIVMNWSSVKLFSTL
ncbi:MAG: hypothetical protein J6B36_08465 [Muribaculaceae bacterium]|nr:hypothetical protein [Muribaculaceae bacterium]